MSSNKTLQSGVRPSQAIRDTTKHKTTLLKDNSWIKRDVEEDELVDKPAEATHTNPATASTSVNSITKSIITTPNSPVTVATSLTKTTSNKPPVPAKNPVLKTPPKSFTARVFSGASSSETVFTPVKRSVNEKSPVSKEPPKEVTNGTKSESKLFTPLSTTVTLVSQTTTTSTSPEKTQTSTAIKTEPLSKSYEPSNGTTAPRSTTTVKSTSFNQTTINVSEPSKTLDTSADILISSLSPTVHTNPVSTTLNTRPSVNQSPTTLESLPLNSPPLSQLSTRIVGRRDLCSFCGKSIVGGERMILDDLQIFSHTTCFKCELCYCSLGNLEAGASLWVHRGMVNCENCYKKTKDRWFR